MSGWTDAMTFSDVWARAVTDRRDHPFLTFERSDGQLLEWTYGEFDELVDRVAGSLAHRGLRAGGAVHLALSNSPAFVAVWLAAVRSGAWIVPSDPASSSNELAGHIERTHPAVGVCSVARRDTYCAALATVDRTIDVIEVDEDDGLLVVFGEHDAPARNPVDISARAAVMFTSGTTGRPKGVEITQANYAFAGSTMAAASGTTAADRHLVVLPLFHANAQYYSFAAAIWAGAAVALTHTFSASRFLEQAARHRVTHASLFAAPIRMILARTIEPAARPGLRHCWYAMNLADHQYANFAELIGCAPRQLYGMTETVPACLTDEIAAPRPSSMGFVTPGCEVAVHRPDGSCTDVDEVGEIVVGGVPGITLFAGYLDDPETTAASFRDGWFLTGDRSRRDGDGRFTFAGRRSEVLKVAGENVSTVEVEQVLAAHPQVLEAAVVGAPDPVRDEVPVGFVVPTDAANPPTIEQLDQWCADRLAKSKRPREITFVDELPRTSVGKIRKFLLTAPAGEGGAR